MPLKDTHGFLSQMKERKSAICRTEGKGAREVTSFALRAGSDLRVLRDRGCCSVLAMTISSLVCHTERAVHGGKSLLTELWNCFFATLNMKI